MNELPVLQIAVIVAFVLYPFAITALTVAIVARSNRVRYPLPLAKCAALLGCLPPIWLITNYGLGKIPSVIVVGSAVFVFSVAATGGLIGAIADLLVPLHEKTDGTAHENQNSVHQG
ncbi:MAG: hypothetical protein GX575_14180 [Candidatus Anammoximicrobium sp.]|jgi:hypothetical protein|nr:hypothetical protein [Candidatus Anammoximicrobium sp.]